MTFLEKLNRLARDRGQSLRALALELDLDPSAPAQWKKRGGLPRPEAAKKLADYFGVPVEVLVDDSRDLPQVEAERAVARQMGLRVNDRTGAISSGSKFELEEAFLVGLGRKLRGDLSDAQQALSSAASALEALAVCADAVEARLTVIRDAHSQVSSRHARALEKAHAAKRSDEK